MKNILLKIEKNKLLFQIIKFGIIGGIAFLIDYGLLYFFVKYCLLSELISAAISFSISVIFNYIMSIKWIFIANKKQTYKEIIIFIVLSVIGLLINEIIIFLGKKIGIYFMISKLISTVIVMVYNFITRKIFIEGE